MDWTLIMASEYTHAVLILLVALGVAQIFRKVLIGIFRKLTEKTESDIDDFIIKVAARPVFWLITAFGLYAAARYLTILQPYDAIVKGTWYVVLAFLLSWMGARIISFFITRWFAAHRGLSGSPRLLNILIAIAIYLVAFILVLSHFNVEFTPFLATLGIGGLAIGLALQPTLSNVFSGLHLIGDQPIRVGDFIELEDGKISGFVEDIGWRSTRIKTLANVIIVIPNARLADSIITNPTMPEPNLNVVIPCGVDYGSDLDKVEKVTIDELQKIQKDVKGAVRDFEPFIRYSEFADSNVNFNIILRAEAPTDRFFLRHEMIKRLHKRYAKERIEISWPVRKVVDSTPKKKR